MTGTAISVVVISVLWGVHAYHRPEGLSAVTAEGAVLVGAMRSAWVTVAALAILATLGMLVPPALLLVGAVVLSHGLEVDVLKAPLVGPLVISDVLLLVYLLRGLAQRRTRAERSRSGGRWLALFLAWSFLATLYAGVPVTPLLRIAVYCAVFLLLSQRGIDRRLVYLGVLCYALVNLVGGVLQGQQRLTGVDIGDPFQTGALLLAALCPLLTSELRFKGRWVVGAMLLCGMFLTQTRSVWFATLAVIAVWAQKKLSAGRVLLVVASLGLMSLKAVDLVTQWLGLNSFSAVLRTQSVINGIRSGLENPVLGSGWGHVSSMDHFQVSGWDSIRQVLPYNLFVNVFASVGLPALLALVLFLGGLLRRLACRHSAPLLFAVAVLAMSLTEMTLYSGSMQTLLFFLYVGIGLGPAEPDDIPPCKHSDVGKAGVTPWVIHHDARAEQHMHARAPAAAQRADAPRVRTGTPSGCRSPGRRHVGVVASSRNASMDACCDLASGFDSTVGQEHGEAAW
ncbi:O-antigen ligase family protein [Streptomyces sp. NPDC001635]